MIQRWEIGIEQGMFSAGADIVPEVDPDGEWVRFEDHQAALDAATVRDVERFRKQEDRITGTDKWADRYCAMEDRITGLEAHNVTLIAEGLRQNDLIAELEKGKGIAYSERDRLVCAVSKVFPAHLERHPDADTSWEDDWRWIVFVQFPTGQASWHIHDSELEWFDHLERRDGNSWDGHSTAEKYARIERFEKIGDLQDYQSRIAQLEAQVQRLSAPVTMYEYKQETPKIWWPNSHLSIVDRIIANRLKEPTK